MYLDLELQTTRRQKVLRAMVQDTIKINPSHLKTSGFVHPLQTPLKRQIVNLQANVHRLPRDIACDISYEELQAAAYEDARRGLPLHSIISCIIHQCFWTIKFHSLSNSSSSNKQGNIVSEDSEYLVKGGMAHRRDTRRRTS